MSYELAWAAGLFEGEGCFSLQRHSPNSKTAEGWVCLTATLCTVDEDVLRRFAQAVGMGNVTGPRPKPGVHRPVWYWSVSGEKVKDLFALLEPGLGERRRARYADIYKERAAYEAATYRNGRIRTNQPKGSE